MEPTLHEGDRVYTTMLPYLFGEPQIGDIVIVDVSLTEPPSYFHMFGQVLRRNAITSMIFGEENIEVDTCWIKRVVGVAGATLIAQFLSAVLAFVYMQIKIPILPKRRSCGGGLY